MFHVVLEGYDPAKGETRFMIAFGRAYGMSISEAREHIGKTEGVLYSFEERIEALKAVDYIEGLGGKARIEERDGGPFATEPAAAKSDAAAETPAEPLPETPPEPPIESPAETSPGRDDAAPAGTSAESFPGPPPESPPESPPGPSPEATIESPPGLAEQDQPGPPGQYPDHDAGPGFGPPPGHPEAGAYNAGPFIAPGMGMHPGHDAAGFGPADGFAGAYAPPPPPYVIPPKVYIKEHDLSSIFSASTSLYFDNFVQLFLVKLIPSAPIILFQFFTPFLNAFTGFFDQSSSSPYWVVLAVFISAIALAAIVGGIYLHYYGEAGATLAASELARGRKIDAIAVLKQVGPVLPVKLALTSLLPNIAFVACFLPAAAIGAIGVAGTYQKSETMIWSGFMGGAIALCLILPFAFYVASMFMFVQPVVVLERWWLVDAMGRSMDLSQGYRWRNIGYVLVLGVIVGVVVVFISSCTCCVPFFSGVVAQTVQLGAAPLMIALNVLLYHEMRLRQGELENREQGTDIGPE